jgi:hypothetical protein
MGDALVGAIALLVLVYLFWTLLRPEL